MPDYDYYTIEKGFIEDYRSILPGTEIYSFQQLTSTITNCLQDVDKYLNLHEKHRQILLERYYDISLSNSCESFTNLVHKILKK